MQRIRTVFMLLLILGFLGTPFSFVFGEAHVRSTSVEGHITEDTTWVSAQSPFVITADCFVDSGCTLTIEPGVVVKFDTGFSLTVFGSLHATGTEANLVIFTSNRPQPAAGDWFTIRFAAGVSESLSMRHCVVEYAVNGITVNTVAKTILENCSLSNNSQSGMQIGDFSNVLVKESSLTFNGAHGVSITGLSNSGIRLIDNNISFNSEKGINLLTESYSPNTPGYASNMTFSGNLISFNKNNGIRLFKYATVDAIVNEITISDNSISSNGREGVQIFSSGEMFDVRISGNNISYNSGNGMNLEISSFSAGSALYDSDISSNLVSFNAESGIFVHVRGEAYEGSIHDVTVSDNIVLSNEDGISLNARKYCEGEASITLTQGNSISANSRRGIFVSGNMRTNITTNSISYNECGVSYEVSADNVANHNDVYGNSRGMTVSGGATVNAEDNFWGAASGPYHALQNPSGSGNLVNGNGTDLDFQPFLLAPIGYINERPVASLLLDRKIATIGETVTLDGSASNDDGHIYKYLFDFGDGYQSGWTTSSTAKHSYSHVGIYNVSLVVMDEYTVKSGTAAMEAINIVRQLPSLVVSLKAEPNTVQSGENSTITIYVSDGKSPVDDATILLASDKNGIFSPEWGHTDPNGQFTCTFVAPLVTARTECGIAVNVTKAGYLDSQAQVTVTVVEDGGADLWVFIVGVAGVIVVIFVWAARRKSGKAE